MLERSMREQAEQDDLHIERTADFERCCNLLRNLLEAGHVCVGEGERREDERCIARVYAGIFNVLGDRV